MPFGMSSGSTSRRCGDYLNTDLRRQVDIVAMWDTIEHLKRPDLFIKKMASDIKPGGLLSDHDGRYRAA